MYIFFYASEAPLLPMEQAKKGVKAWIIEWRGVKIGGMDRPVVYIEARPRRIIMEQDADLDRFGWNVYFKTIDGLPSIGRWGGRYPIFSEKPNDGDIERYVRARTENKPEYTKLPIRGWEE